MTAKFNSIPPPTYGSKSCLTPYDSINLPLVDYSDSEDDEFETCPEFQSQVEFQDNDDNDDSDELDPSDFNTDIDYQVYLATKGFDDPLTRRQRYYTLEAFLIDCLKEGWCSLCINRPGEATDCVCFALRDNFHCQGCGKWNVESDGGKEVWGIACEENECECELVNA